MVLTFNTVSLHGAPRSGTTWLGRIFDSHPGVAYRYQPLFSYRFKGAIDDVSKPGQVKEYLQQLYDVNDDEFILQQKQVARGVQPLFADKKQQPETLVMKEVRYHYVIPALLRAVPGIKLIGIVRHPCGVMNSWLKTPREFLPEWDVLSEWRDAPSKNRGKREEYFGFNKWRELACLFLKLKQDYPDEFRLIRYEDLVAQPEQETQKLFDFCGLDMHSQVRDFLCASQQQDVDDPDSVYRSKNVVDRWKQELPGSIRDNILVEIMGTELEVFL
jgi:hypothetical protein